MCCFRECGASKVRAAMRNLPSHTSVSFIKRSVYRLPTALSASSRTSLTSSAFSLSFASRQLGSEGGHFSAVSRQELHFRRDHLLLPLLEAKRSRLRDLQAHKTALDQTARRYADRFFFSSFAMLIVQFAVLFDWTYIHFDWNFVEPITYLLGYCETWIALAWYGNMHREYEQDSLREIIERKQQNKLYLRHALDLSELNRLKEEVEVLEMLVRVHEATD
ncbi:unnamed protein product [Phytomonas sp. Hart1]|nr:unnamed protein product [Phytomonas sp. Hart1]|eukprot:CCW71823.1 unnamed protein product [Phytomonas sp. isolate Hart1]